ncbi:iron donor protein CyaY [Luminiphilus sp. nBUS_16]|uniref:iron donor protein CyaY n=1 Tax=unclassified Luminiphilus TaxID=2633198 RepID=UPI003EBFE660
MTSTIYFDRIDETFDCVETRLEALPEDPDLSVAEGVINARFANGVVFVFSRQPPTEQLWLATPGGGFHYVWDDALGDWRDTKTADAFREFLPKQLREHAKVEFSWD